MQTGRRPAESRTRLVRGGRYAGERKGHDHTLDAPARSPCEMYQNDACRADCESLPMSCTLPHSREKARNHKIPEQSLYDDPTAQQVVSIDINSRDAADGPACRYEQHPVPLPSPPDCSEPLLLRQKQAAVPMQAQQRKHDGDGEQDAERNPRAPPMLDSVERNIARGSVEDGSVREDGRHAFDARQHEIAPGSVGKGAIVEKNKVVLIEGGKVVVLPVHDRVGRVCARGEVDLGSGLESEHGGGPDATIGL